MKLKRFVINDLFGYQMVDIPFEKNIKILIGENGLGKTTVLNTLYFVLSRKFDRLMKVSFSSIELHIDNKKKIIINKNELGYYLESKKEKGRSHFNDILGKSTKEHRSQLKTIIDSKQQEQSKRLEVQKILNEIGIKINAPTHYVYDMVRKFLAEEEANNFLKAIEDLDKFIDFKILYFPTYRRIEEELKNIGFVPKKEIVERYGHNFLEFEEEFDEEEDERKSIDDDIIQFGMQDVDDRIKNLTREIARSSLSGFSEITGQMLHQLLTEFPDVKTNKGANLEVNKLQIILERVGPSIGIEDKQ